VATNNSRQPFNSARYINTLCATTPVLQDTIYHTKIDQHWRLSIWRRRRGTAEYL